MSAAATGRHRPRVLISHQGCIPIYRRPLFERLARIPDIEYVVAYGNPPHGTSYIIAEPPFSFPALRIDNRTLPLGSTACIWQPLVGPFWRDFDAAILGDEIKYLSHLAIMGAARLKRRPVILWGFGYPAGQRDGEDLSRAQRLQRALKSGFRRAELHLIDGYLAYTSSGADSLVQAGLPRERIATVRNTIDIEAQARLRAMAACDNEAEIRTHLGIAADAKVLLYFGRFLPDKRVDMLIRYARRSAAASRKVAVVLSGAGLEHDRLAEAARGLDNVVFRSLFELELARALRIATAVVIPGFSGLAIPHAFAHGVPFITRRGILHPPEIDYLTDGENGLMLPHDEPAFFGGLDRFLDDAPLQARLGQGAELAASHLSMDAMAAAFDGLVRRLLQEHGRLPESTSAVVTKPAAGNAA